MKTSFVLKAVQGNILYAIVSKVASLEKLFVQLMCLEVGLRSFRCAYSKLDRAVVPSAHKSFLLLCTPRQKPLESPKDLSL